MVVFVRVMLISWPSACHVLLSALVTAPPALDRQALYYRSALHCQSCYKADLGCNSCILTVLFCALQAGQWR